MSDTQQQGVIVVNITVSEWFTARPKILSSTAAPPAGRDGGGKEVTLPFQGLSQSQAGPSSGARPTQAAPAAGRDGSGKEAALILIGLSQSQAGPTSGARPTQPAGIVVGGGSGTDIPKPGRGGRGIPKKCVICNEPASNDHVRGVHCKYSKACYWSDPKHPLRPRHPGRHPTGSRDLEPGPYTREHPHPAYARTWQGLGRGGWDRRTRAVHARRRPMHGAIYMYGPISSS
eukprot:gene708-2135_t